MDEQESREKKIYDKDGIYFTAQFKTYINGKLFNKGDILPWEYRNATGSISAKGNIKTEKAVEIPEETTKTIKVRKK